MLHYKAVNIAQPVNDNLSPFVFEITSPKPDVYLLDDMTKDDVIYETVMDLIEAVIYSPTTPALLAEIFTDRFTDLMEK